MFNAGVLTGLLLDMKLELAVVFGCATAGVYGQYGHLPTLENVFTFIQTEKLRATNTFEI